MLAGQRRGGAAKYQPARFSIVMFQVLKFSRVSVQEVLANPPPAARLHKVQLLVSSERPAASRSSPDRPHLERQVRGTKGERFRTQRRPETSTKVKRPPSTGTSPQDPLFSQTSAALLWSCRGANIIGNQNSHKLAKKVQCLKHFYNSKINVIFCF